MRPLSIALREKIEKAFQTLYDGSDPHMDITLSKSQEIIDRIERFVAHTLWENDPGRIDIAVERPSIDFESTGIHLIYIKGGVAYYAKSDMAVAYEKMGFEDLETLGSATDVAIEFDGEWAETHNARKRLQTIGEPWLFWVDNGALKAKQYGSELEVTTLASDNVTRVQALRGWRNPDRIEFDQGIVAAYIRNGELKYRNYCYQSDESRFWESEKEVEPINDYGTPEEIGLFRTNDYRMGFLAEIDGQIYWAITRRTWAAMAIPPERIEATLRNMEITMLGIQFEYVSKTEYIEATLTNMEIAMIGVDFVNADSPETIEVTLTNMDLDFWGPDLEFVEPSEYIEATLKNVDIQLWHKDHVPE